MNIRDCVYDLCERIRLVGVYMCRACVYVSELS